MTSELTTEVLVFDSGEEFRNDTKLVIPAFKVALQANGVHAPGYFGKQIEEPSTKGCLFLNWDNIEAHQALIKGPTYPAVIEGVKPCLGGDGKVEIYHVIFSAPTIALEKPVTELLILTLKAPENRAAVVDILSKISKASEKILVFGQTLENENKYILIGGWPTVEAHWETVAKPAYDELDSLANKDLHIHIKLSQYSL